RETVVLHEALFFFEDDRERHLRRERRGRFSRQAHPRTPRTRARGHRRAERGEARTDQDEAIGVCRALTLELRAPRMHLRMMKCGVVRLDRRELVAVEGLQLLGAFLARVEDGFAELGL